MKKIIKKNKITKKLLMTTSALVLNTMFTQEAVGQAQAAAPRSVMGAFNLSRGSGLNGNNVAFVNNSTLTFKGKRSGCTTAQAQNNAQNVRAVFKIKAINIKGQDLINNNKVFNIRNNTEIGSIVDYSKAQNAAQAALQQAGAAAQMKIKVNDASLTLTGTAAQAGDFTDKNAAAPQNNYSALGKVVLHHANAKLIVNNGITLAADVDNTLGLLNGVGGQGILEFRGTGSVNHVGATNSLAEMVVNTGTVTATGNINAPVKLNHANSKLILEGNLTGDVINNHAQNNNVGQIKFTGGVAPQAQNQQAQIRQHAVTGNIGVAGQGKTGLEAVVISKYDQVTVDGNINARSVKLNGADSKLILVGGHNITGNIINNRGKAGNDYSGVTEFQGQSTADGNIGTDQGHGQKTGLEEVIIKNGTVTVTGNIKATSVTLNHNNSKLILGGDLTGNIINCVNNHNRGQVEFRNGNHTVDGNIGTVRRGQNGKTGLAGVIINNGTVTLNGYIKAPIKLNHNNSKLIIADNKNVIGNIINNQAGGGNHNRGTVVFRGSSRVVGNIATVPGVQQNGKTGLAGMDLNNGTVTVTGSIKAPVKLNHANSKLILGGNLEGNINNGGNNDYEGKVEFTGGNNQQNVIQHTVTGSIGTVVVNGHDGIAEMVINNNSKVKVTGDIKSPVKLNDANSKLILTGNLTGNIINNNANNSNIGKIKFTGGKNNAVLQHTITGDIGVAGQGKTGLAGVFIDQYDEVTVDGDIIAPVRLMDANSKLILVNNKNITGDIINHNAANNNKGIVEFQRTSKVDGTIGSAGRGHDGIGVMVLRGAGDVTVTGSIKAARIKLNNANSNLILTGNNERITGNIINNNRNNNNIGHVKFIGGQHNNTQYTVTGNIGVAGRGNTGLAEMVVENSTVTVNGNIINTPVKLNNANSKLIVANGKNIGGNIINNQAGGGNDDEGIIEFRGQATVDGDIGAQGNGGHAGIGKMHLNNGAVTVDGNIKAPVKLNHANSKLILGGNLEGNINNGGNNDYEGKVEFTGGNNQQNVIQHIVTGSIGTVVVNGHAGIAEMVINNNSKVKVTGDIKSPVKLAGANSKLIIEGNLEGNIINNSAANNNSGVVEFQGQSTVNGNIGTDQGHAMKTGLEKMIINKGTVTVTGDIKALVELNNANAKLILANGKTITGNVNNTMGGANGKLEFTQNGTMAGNVSDLAAVKLAGGTVNFGGNIKATKINLDSANAKLILANGKTITGNVNNTMGGANGKLEFTQNGTMAGNVSDLAAVKLAGGTVNFGGNIKATKINLDSANAKLILANGKTITGDVDNTAGGANGKLEFAQNGTMAGNVSDLDSVILGDGLVNLNGDVKTKHFHLGHRNSIANVSGNLNVTDSITTAVGNTGILRISKNNFVLDTQVGTNLAKLDAIEIADDYKLTVNKDVHLANGIRALQNNKGTVITSGQNINAGDIIASGAVHKLKLFEVSDINAKINLTNTKDLSVNTINLTNRNQTLNINNSNFGGKVTGSGTVTISGNSTLNWLGENNNRLKKLEITAAAGNVTLNKTPYTDNFAVNGGSTLYNSKTLGFNNIILSNNAKIRFNQELTDPLKVQGRGQVTLAGGGSIGFIGTPGMPVAKVTFLNHKNYSLATNIYSDSINFDRSVINPVNINSVIIGTHNKVPNGWAEESQNKLITAQAAKIAADKKLQQKAEKEEQKRLKLVAEAAERLKVEEQRVQMQQLAKEKAELIKQKENAPKVTNRLIEISNSQIVGIETTYKRNLASIEEGIRQATQEKDAALKNSKIAELNKRKQQATEKYAQEVSKNLAEQVVYEVANIEIKSKQANTKSNPIAKKLADTLLVGKTSKELNNVKGNLLAQRQKLEQRLVGSSVDRSHINQDLKAIDSAIRELNVKETTTKAEAKKKAQEVKQDITAEVQKHITADTDINIAEIKKLKNTIFDDSPEQFDQFLSQVGDSIEGDDSSDINVLAFSDGVINKEDQKVLDALRTLKDPEATKAIKDSDHTADAAVVDPVINDMFAANMGNINHRISNVIGVGAGDDNVRGLDNVWITGMYNTSSQNKLSEKDAGYKGTTSGVTAGVDYRVSEDSIIGISLGNMTSTIKTKNTMPETIKVDNYTYSLYSSTELTNQLHWDNIFSLAQSDVKTTRTLTASGISATGKGKYKNNSYNVSTTLGYKIKAGKTGITILPSVGLNYGHHSNGEYKEKGLGIDNRNIKANSSNSLFGTVGTKFVTTKHISDNLTITPDIHTAISTQLNSTKRTIQLKLGLDDQFKEVKIKNKNNTTYNFGAGATAEINKIVDVSLGYDFNMRKKYKSHQGSLKLKVSF